MVDAIERFRSAFSRWVDRHNARATKTLDAKALCDDLEARMGADRLRHIGVALQNGWLSFDESGRGFWSAEPEPVAGTSRGARRYPLVPGQWWEFYVQLADYSRIRQAATDLGVVVRLEDDLMDIAVWAGGRLRLFVENKVDASVAARLVDRMQRIGAEGFALDAADKGNDPLRKAKYLFRARARPEYFAVSAIGHEQLYRVAYGESDQRFALEPEESGIVECVLGARAEGATPPRRGADAFVSALERLAGSRVWISHGTGQTMLNVYVVENPGDEIAAGVYEDGRVWTNTARLGGDRAARLAAELGKWSIDLDTSKGWAFWTIGSAPFVLSDENGEDPATAIASIA